MSSSIEWTEETWNPVTGCSPVSEGCRNCYAARHALRLAGHPHDAVRAAYEGTAAMRGHGDARRPVFTGEVRLQPARLPEPLGWRKPRRVFVNSMSDLFHPSVPEDFLDQVWAVMALSPRHTFQILTKRPAVMADYVLRAEKRVRAVEIHALTRHASRSRLEQVQWPLPNVWLGTSVEDQAAANERIPHLLEAPAALRFLSCEPLLGHVSLYPEWLLGRPQGDLPTIGWVIVGGESGPRARPCDILWIHWLVTECILYEVPVFVKQLGARPYQSDAKLPRDVWLDLDDRKGGDPEEWPEDLHFRQFPEAPHPPEKVPEPAKV